MLSIQVLSDSLDPDVLAALADDDGDQSPDPQLLEYALRAAEGEAGEELLRGGYNYPENPSVFLKNLVVSLAVERLFHRRRALVPGVWSDRAAHARVVLKEIGDGRRALAGVARSNRVFSNSDETGLLQDQDAMGEM